MSKFDDVSKTIESNDLFKSMENSNRVQFIALCVDVFKLGEKSKQAEIDELNKKLKSNERVFKKLKDQMVSHACESDELRRRINDAVKALEHSKPLMICYSDALLALDILKGTTNEQ